MPRASRAAATIAAPQGAPSFIWSILVLIFAAIGAYLAYLAPDWAGLLFGLKINTISIPLVLAINLSLVPTFFQANFSELRNLGAHSRLILLGVFQTWFLAPIVAIIAALLILDEKASILKGVILLGMFRSTTVVNVWNNFAGGSASVSTALAALNSISQVVLFPAAMVVFGKVMPELLELPHIEIRFTIGGAALYAFIYVGIPLIWTYAAKRMIISMRGEAFVSGELSSQLGTLGRTALVFAVFIMYFINGDALVSMTSDSIYIAVTLCLISYIMFSFSYLTSWILGASRAQCTAMALSAGSFNFELALAVVASIKIGAANGSAGSNSGELLAVVAGQLVDIPTQLVLVFVARLLQGDSIKSARAKSE